MCYDSEQFAKLKKTRQTKQNADIRKIIKKTNKPYSDCCDKKIYIEYHLY